jgi:hypothetical protein
MKGIFDSIPSRPPRGKRISPLIKSIGIELECEMSEEAFERLQDYKNYIYHPRIAIDDDGSLEAVNQDCTSEVTFWSTDMKEIQEFLRIMYQELGVTTNWTCGLHVHVKAAHGRTALMATRTYWQGFYRAYNEYANSSLGGTNYLDRIDNEWCEMRPYVQEEVVYTLEGNGLDDRYVAINLNSLHKHAFKTVEHRILPAQSSYEEAVRTLGWFTQTCTKLMRASLDSKEETSLVSQLSSGALKLLL